MDTTTAFALNSRDRWVAGCNERDQVIRQLHTQIGGLTQSINTLKSNLQETKEELAIETMDAAGLRASIEFVKQLGQKSAFAYQASGKLYKDGRVKPNITLVYEAAFDKKGHEIGITNPVAYREE